MECQETARDSIFADGKSIFISRTPAEIESRDFNGKAMEIMSLLSEAEAVTITALSIAAGYNRQLVQKSLTSLWHAGLARWVAVATAMGIFKLWLCADTRPPKTPDEACRMAVLGMYFALARKEVPGFEWRLIRGKRAAAHAEMSLIMKANEEKGKVLIDAPRRGDKMLDGADIYIFPTHEEAAMTPVGKRYTTDLAILINGESLKQKILLKE